MKLTNEQNWECTDRYGQFRASKIVGTDGSQTGFSMVESFDPEKKVWDVEVPVSNEYQPVSTAMLVDLVRSQFRRNRHRARPVRHDASISASIDYA